MINASIPLQQIQSDLISARGLRMFILRLDLTHPYISGNKLYKLHYNLKDATRQQKKTLLTFGGAFSNHIAATAVAGKEYGFSTIGIIRGDEDPQLNPTLQSAVENGMKLYYVSRSLYRDKKKLSSYVEQQFKDIDFYLIPEGGSNEPGIKGCTEILKNIPIDFDYVCCPCGTGATMTGITLSLKNKQMSLGFQVLKAENYIRQEVNNWLTHFRKSSQTNWTINEDYHFGGYAKINTELIDFIIDFEIKNKIPLDYVYTGKMMFGIFDLIKKNYFKGGETIVAIHTGGLQGNKGINFLKKN